MSDLALVPVVADSFEGCDLTLINGDLALDHGLRTAVIVSLFTDHGSWWGDALSANPADRLGSTLWQLARETRRDDVLVRTRESVRAALAWLIEDRVARAVTVTAEFVGDDRIAVAIAIDRAEGRELIRFSDLWTATLEPAPVALRSKAPSSPPSIPIGGLGP